MKIGIANDHGGYELKLKLVEYLEKEGYEVINFGANVPERSDYPDYAIPLGEAIRDKKVDYGIAICISAIGVSVACNKVKGVRCGKVDSLYEVEHGKSNDYINCIAISGSLDFDEAVSFFEALVNTKHITEDPRYFKRVQMIIDYEESI